MIAARRATPGQVSEDEGSLSASNAIDPLTSAFAPEEAELQPRARTAPGFVDRSYRRIRAFLKTVIERIEPPQFPGCC